MSINKLVVISLSYPTIRDSVQGSFVKELVAAFSRLGVNCTVIRPVRATDVLLGHRLPLIREVKVERGCPITEVSPPFLSLSTKKIFGFNTGRITRFFFEGAVKKVFKNLDLCPDAVYGHFLYLGGGAAATIGREFGIPSFVAVGEGIFWSVKPFGFIQAYKDFREVRGMIAVSSLLKRKLIQEIGIPEEKIIVVPNGVDLNTFRPMNRTEARRRLKIPADMFVVAFVGKFDHNKGVMRIIKATQNITGLGLILIGSGDLDPNSDNILFKGRIQHDKIPEYLSASDIFVLPTLHEGSCNALLEAMACGLPLVTSLGEFNDDIVDSKVAIRVDPENILAIREAILQLKNSEDLRKKMSFSAENHIKQFDINSRAEKIIDWMNKRI